MVYTFWASVWDFPHCLNVRASWNYTIIFWCYENKYILCYYLVTYAVEKDIFLAFKDGQGKCCIFSVQHNMQRYHSNPIKQLFWATIMHLKVNQNVLYLIQIVTSKMQLHNYSFIVIICWVEFKMSCLDGPCRTFDVHKLHSGELHPWCTLEISHSLSSSRS